jgi:hypothetical protein
MNKTELNMANQRLQNMTATDYYSVPENARSTSTNDMTPLQFAKLLFAPDQTFMQHNSQQIQPENYNLPPVAHSPNAYKLNSGTAPLSAMQPYCQPTYQGPNFQPAQNSTGWYRSHPESSVPFGDQNTVDMSFNNAASHAHGDGNYEELGNGIASFLSHPNQAALQYQGTVQQNYNNVPNHQETIQQNYNNFPQYQSNASHAQRQQGLPAQNVALSQQRPIVREHSPQFQPWLENGQQMRQVTSAPQAQNMFGSEQAWQQTMNFTLDNQPPQNTLGCKQARQQTMDFALNNLPQGVLGYEQARRQTTNFTLDNQPQQWSFWGTQANVASAPPQPQPQPQSQARSQPRAPIQSNAHAETEAQMQYRAQVQAQAQVRAQAQTWAQAPAQRQAQANQAFNSHSQNRARPNYAAPPNTRMVGTQLAYLDRSAGETNQPHTSQRYPPMPQSNSNGKRTAEDKMFGNVPKRRKSPLSLSQNLVENHIQENSYMVPSSVRAPSQRPQAFEQYPVTRIQQHNQSAQIPAHNLAMPATTHQSHQQFQSRDQSGSTFNASEASATRYNNLTNTSTHTPQRQGLTSTRPQNYNSAHHLQGPQQPGQVATHARPNVNGSFHHESQQWPQMQSNGNLLNNMSAPIMPHSGPREAASRAEQRSSRSSRSPFPVNAIRAERAPSVVRALGESTKEDIRNSRLSLNEDSSGNALRGLPAFDKTMEPGSTTGLLRHKEDSSESANDKNGEGSITSREISDQVSINVGQSTEKKTSAPVVHNTTGMTSSPACLRFL